MSDKPFFPSGRIAARKAALAALICAASICPMDALPFDPLLAIPDELETGVPLPDETMPPSCDGQANAPSPLTLKAAVVLALCNNPQIRIAWSNVGAQAAALGEARAAWMPTLSAGVGRLRDTNRYSGGTIEAQTVERSMANASFNWRVLDFGGRSANHRAAESQLAAALAGHDAARQKILLAVVQAYHDALAARAAATARSEQEALSSQTLALARRLEAKGAGTRGETQQAAMAHARAILECSRADATSRKAVAQLMYAMGMNMNTATVPELAGDPEAADGSLERLEPLNHWQEVARTRHPAIVAARSQLDAARTKIDAIGAEGLPTLDFSANRYRNGRPGQTLPLWSTQETTIGLTLNIPLFEGFSRTYKELGQQAQASAKEAELSDAMLQVSLEIARAHADAQAAQRNLDASVQLLDAATEAQASARRKFEQRAGNLGELINLQSALSEARQERIRCLAEWRSARLRLMAGAGILGKVDAL